MNNALIVDDSKVARVTLQKLLDRFNIVSDMVESGEEALRYLQDNNPSIIFMDHMMPGMDGFQAVKAIKADPKKSHIPIVMHTTRSAEGDVYIGQAKALGAKAILPKPASDQELSDVLERLKTSAASASNNYNVTIEDFDVDALNEAIAADETIPMQAITRENSQVARSTTQSFAAIERPEAQTSSTLRQALSVIILVAPIVVMLAFYFPVQRENDQLVEGQSALYRSIEWAVNQSGDYDFGELPMSGKRLEILEGLVVQLVAANFVGIVRVESHVGAFCLIDETLSSNEVVQMLPLVDMPLSQCASIGASASEAFEQSGGMSKAFANFMNNSPLLSNPNIKLEVVQFGASMPQFDYPSDLQGSSAGDWNEVALRNNRVNFKLIPLHGLSEL